jgi:hypothetical protein
MHTQANDDYVPFGDEWRRYEAGRCAHAGVRALRVVGGAVFRQAADGVDPAGVP